MRLLFPVLLYLIVSLTSGCEEMDKNDSKKWGLKKVEFVETLELKNESYMKKMKYVCSKSSPKFEFRLYYIFEEQDVLTAKDNVEEKILESLVGFTIQFIDVKNNKELAKYIVRNSSFWDNNAFNHNDPLSLWLASGIKVQKGKEYEILLILPSKKDTNFKFLKPILVGGIARDVFW